MEDGGWGSESPGHNKFEKLWSGSFLIVKGQSIGYNQFELLIIFMYQAKPTSYFKFEGPILAKVDCIL